MPVKILDVEKTVKSFSRRLSVILKEFDSTRCALMLLYSERTGFCIFATVSVISVEGIPLPKIST